MTYLKRTKLVYAMYAGKIGSGSVVLFEFWFSEEEFRYWVHTVIVSLISIKSEVLKSKLSITDFSLEKGFFLILCKSNFDRVLLYIFPLFSIRKPRSRPVLAISYQDPAACPLYNREREIYKNSPETSTLKQLTESQHFFAFRFYLMAVIFSSFLAY